MLARLPRYAFAMYTIFGRFFVLFLNLLCLILKFYGAPGFELPSVIILSCIYSIVCTTLTNVGYFLRKIGRGFLEVMKNYFFF